MRHPTTKWLAEHLRASLHAVWSLPQQLSVENPHRWRNLVAASGLSGRASEDTWSKLLGELHGMLICPPGDLAQSGVHQFHLISGNPESNRLSGQLRGAVRLPGGATDFMEMADPALFVAGEWDAYKLAEAVAAGDAATPESGRILSARVSRLGLSADTCESSGPRYGARRAAETAGSVGEISQFAHAGARLNILRNCDASLRPVASDLRCWGILCGSTSRPPLSTNGGGGASAACFLRNGQIFGSIHSPFRKSLTPFGTQHKLAKKSRIRDRSCLAKAGH